MKLYIEKRKSQKNDKEYLALVAQSNPDTKPKIITFDVLTIYKLTGKKKADLTLGQKIDIT